MLFVIIRHAYLFFQWIIYWKQATKCCIYKITTILKLVFTLVLVKYSLNSLMSYQDEALCLFLLPWLVNDRGMLHVDYLHFLYFIVTQILLNQHVNCFSYYDYFFLYCIVTDSTKSACKLIQLLQLLLTLLYCHPDFTTFIQSAHRCRMG